MLVMPMFGLIMPESQLFMPNFGCFTPNFSPVTPRPPKIANLFHRFKRDALARSSRRLPVPVIG